MHQRKTFFGSSSLNIFDDLALGNVAKQHQLFMKAERPFNNIRLLRFPIPAGIQQTSSWSGYGGFIGTFAFTSFVEVTLLKVPLAVGADPENPFALDQLVWDDSFFKTSHMSGPVSTLYADPNNFEHFVSPKLGGSRFAFLSPPGAGSIAGTSHNYVMLEIAFSDDVGGLRTKADNGPFFGIHIFFNPVNEGGWMASGPNATTTASLLAAGFRPTAEVGTARSFIMLDDLGAVTE